MSTRPAFGKTTPLKREHFADFEQAFGNDPFGKAKRKDQGGGRFRRFSRDQIAARDDNLDIARLRDEEAEERLTEAEDIAAAIMEHLRSALDEIEALTAAFSGELTKGWREKNVYIECAEDLVERTPTPAQPRGGRDASERFIPGVAALSVNDPSVNDPSICIPRGWKWVPLNPVSRQETGHTPSRSHPEWWEGDIPWIGIKDAAKHHGGYIYETFQHTNGVGLANSAARLLPANTVCLSRTASIGYAIIMGRPTATSQDFVTWTCSDALLVMSLSGIVDLGETNRDRNRSVCFRCSPPKSYCVAAYPVGFRLDTTERGSGAAGAA
jgi:Type I restriction modification DNA specificity domain